jgi:1,5-anhydro-D-fructose reductase (1,5-anhydro-D-mannitol-forming)
LWRLDPAIAGAGLFFDLGSHCVDLLDFLVGPITSAAGFAMNTGGAYSCEDVTAAAFTFGGTAAGTGMWNFNGPGSADVMTFLGPEGTLRTPIFSDTDVVVTIGNGRRIYEVRNPPHVHQPLVQTIVDELRGQGACDSTAESGARASWVLEQCISGYYNSRP